jgi:hypothetical protein
METGNFFNLNLSHKTVCDFNEDHQKSIRLFSDSQAYLNKEFKNEESYSYEDAIEFFRNINQIAAEMKKTFIDFIISHAAFRKLAETDEAVRKEFKKLPGDFTPIREHFEKLISAYEQELKNLEKVL